MHEFFEEERHRAEVRQVLRWRAQDRSTAINYLAKVRKARGDAAADRLTEDCRTQWDKGNRGIQGDWR